MLVDFDLSSVILLVLLGNKTVHFFVTRAAEEFFSVLSCVLLAPRA